MKIVLDPDNRLSRNERNKTLSSEKILKRELESLDTLKTGYIENFKVQYNGDFDKDILPNIKTLEIKTLDDARNQMVELINLIFSSKEIQENLDPTYLTELSNKKNTIISNAESILLQKATYELEFNETNRKEEIIQSLRNMDEGSLIKSVVDNGDNTISVYTSNFGIYKVYNYQPSKDEEGNNIEKRIVQWETKKVFDNSDEGIKRNFQLRKLTNAKENIDVKKLNYPIYYTINTLYKDNLIETFSKKATFEGKYVVQDAKYDIKPIHVCVSDTLTEEDYRLETLRLEEIEKINKSVSHVNKPTPKKSSTLKNIEENEDKIRSIYPSPSEIINEVKSEIINSNEEVVSEVSDTNTEEVTPKLSVEENDLDIDLSIDEDPYEEINKKEETVSVKAEEPQPEIKETPVVEEVKEQPKKAEIIKDKVERKISNIDELVEEKVSKFKEQNKLNYYEKLKADLKAKQEAELISLNEKINKAEATYKKKFSEFITALQNGNDMEQAKESVGYKSTEIDGKLLDEEMKNELLASFRKDEIIKEEKELLKNALKRVERQNEDLSERSAIINKLNSEKEQFLEDIQQLNTQNIELIELSKDLQDTISSKESEIFDLKEEIENKDKEYQELEDEVNELYEVKTKYDEISPLFEEAKVVVVKLNEDNIELKDENEKLKAKLAEMEKQLKFQNEKVEDLEKDVKTLNSSNAELRKDKENLQKSLDRTYDNLDKSNKRTEELITKLSEDTKMFNGKYEEQLKRIKDLESEIDNLKKNKPSLNKQVKNLKDEVKGYDKEVSKFNDTYGDNSSDTDSKDDTSKRKQK